MEQKKVSEKKLFEGKVLSLYLSNFSNSRGRNLEREIVKRKNAAGILAVTDKDKIILVKQYRQAVEQLMWEIPAGIIDEGESALDTAKRELIEETGFKANEIEELTRYFSSAGFTDEEVVVYLATGLTYVGEEPEDDEEFEIKEFSIKETLSMINSGEIIDAKTIIAIILLANLRDIPCKK